MQEGSAVLVFTRFDEPDRDGLRYARANGEGQGDNEQRKTPKVEVVSCRRRQEISANSSESDLQSLPCAYCRPSAGRPTSSPRR